MNVMNIKVIFFFFFVGWLAGFLSERSDILKGMVKVIEEFNLSAY